MIDLSKFQKLYSYHKHYGWLFSTKTSPATIIYLVKIGEDIYIDSSIQICTTVWKYARDLDKGIHANALMQEAFNKHLCCDFYLIEQVGFFELPCQRTQYYVNKYQPTLNAGRAKDCMNPDYWVKVPDDGVEVTIKLPWYYTDVFSHFEKQCGIPKERFVEAAVKYFYRYHTYRDSDDLTNFGVILIDDILSKKDW